MVIFIVYSQSHLKALNMAANLTLWPQAWQPISPYVPEHGGKSHLTAQNMAANLT